MKGRATIAGSSVRGTAKCISTATASAVVFGMLTATGKSALAPIDGAGERDRSAGLFHWLDVKPEAPQEFVWLTPVVGIDYTITTSTGLKWQIK